MEHRYSFRKMVEIEKFISVFFTILIAWLLYFSLNFYELPEIKVKQVELKKEFIEIDPKDFIKPEPISRVAPKQPPTEKAQQQRIIKPKLPGPDVKMEIKEIRKLSRNILNVSEPSETTRERFKASKTLPHLDHVKHSNPVQQGLAALKRFSDEGTPLKIGKKFGSFESDNMVAEEGIQDSQNDYKISSGTPGHILGTPEGRGGDNWPALALGYIPKKNEKVRQLKEIIKWIKNNNEALSYQMNQYLQKRQDDYTARTRFNLKPGNKKCEIFFRATPPDEIAYAICIDSTSYLIIDQNVDKEGDLLKVGTVTHDTKDEIEFIRSSKTKITSEIDSLQAKILYGWWDYKKKTNLK